jgi:uncharacterized protein YlxP (DUF503 family)
MARVCTICSSENADSIDASLVSGQTLRSVSKAFDVSAAALGRHRLHLSPAIVKVAQERDRAHVVSLLDRVERLVSEAESVLSVAKDTGKASLALAAIREVRESLKLLGQVTGEIRPDGAVQVSVVNLVESSEWRDLSRAILRALAPFDEAREAVARALTSQGATPPRLVGPGRPVDGQGGDQ